MKQFVLPADYGGERTYTVRGPEFHYLVNVLRLSQGSSFAGLLNDGTPVNLELVSIRTDYCILTVEKAQRQSREKIRSRWRELFEHRMRNALKQFADSAGLTDGQLQKLTQLAYETIDETVRLQQAYQRGEITPAQFLEKSKKARQEMDKKARNLLGEEVFQKFVKARRKFLGRR